MRRRSSVVEVDEDDLLPGSERELAFYDRNRLRRSDHRCAQVCVRVGVVVADVVLVVTGRRDQPVEQRLEIVRRRRARTPSW